jgi:hypothetical protein
VQTFALSTSTLLRYKGGETPQLALATPRLRQVAFGIWLNADDKDQSEERTP